MKKDKPFDQVKYLKKDLASYSSKPTKRAQKMADILDEDIKYLVSEEKKNASIVQTGQPRQPKQPSLKDRKPSKLSKVKIAVNSKPLTSKQLQNITNDLKDFL